MRRTRNKGNGQVQILDSAKDGSVPMRGAPNGGKGVISDIFVETSLIQRQAITFVDSPFGNRYMALRPRPTQRYDIAIRGSVWAFDVKGYFDYGSFTYAAIPGTADGHELLQDWYVLVREMGKRALKYKHLPVTISNKEWLRTIMNIYFYAAANLVTLICLSRLYQWNMASSLIGVYLPRYMSRVTRAYRRLSAIRMAPFIKAHAVRSGIPFQTAPYSYAFRLWSPRPFFVTIPGITSINAASCAIVQSEAHLNTLVANLEQAIRFLESGDASDEFTAVRDLIDMTDDIPVNGVQGSFLPGLPRIEDLPGAIPDPRIKTEMFGRWLGWKDIVNAGTDQWIGLLPSSHGNFAGLLPVQGFGNYDLYDFTSLGKIKYHIFNTSATSTKEDVNSIVRLVGTEHRIRDMLDYAALPSVEEMFGTGITYCESWISNALATTTGVVDSLDLADAASLQTFISTDSQKGLHPWYRGIIQARLGFPSGWTSFVDESERDYFFLMNPEDVPLNYLSFLSGALGVPYGIG